MNLSGLQLTFKFVSLIQLGPFKEKPKVNDGLNDEDVDEDILHIVVGFDSFQSLQAENIKELACQLLSRLSNCSGCEGCAFANDGRFALFGLTF